MSEPETSSTTAQVKELLFKRYENLTVLSIFASFVAIVVIIQLISTGGSRFPTFISPVNIVNILQQVAVPGIVAISMTMVMVSAASICLSVCSPRWCRSSCRLAFPNGILAWVRRSFLALRRRSSLRPSWGSSFP